jgi:two-component system, NtrC family, response regulator GlrR
MGKKYSFQPCGLGGRRTMARLLLLESGEAAAAFAGQIGEILASAVSPVLELRRERLSSTDPLGLRSEVSRIVAAFSPAVVLLVQKVVTQSAGLLRLLRAEPPALPIIVVGEARAADEVLEVLRLGATDYLTPPLSSVDLLPRVWRSLPPDRDVRPSAALLETLRAAGLVGRSPGLLSEVAKIPAVSSCDASVLISGETGTGKELVARAIHKLGPRASFAFIPVNCGAIPVELVENELFGHAKGAFTSADSSFGGLIQEADGGTLFLDEIDALPLLAQVKLLRFLQDHEYRALGSRETRHADVRVITATSIDFEHAVEKGVLRKDLYYRLNIIPLSLPPLRERREDIAPLASHFVSKYAAGLRKPATSISPEAAQKLVLHDWPGNVRELEHVIERAVALCGGPILQAHDVVLSAHDDSAPDASFRQAKAKAVEAFERTYLQGLLLAHQGNITRAALAARKNRRAFFELLRKHRIDASHFRGPEAVSTRTIPS